MVVPRERRPPHRRGLNGCAQGPRLRTTCAPRHALRSVGRRFVPAAGSVACGLEPRVPGRLGCRSGSRRHGFSREEAEGRGGGSRGGGETGEAGGRPEGSGGGDRRDRALHELTRLRAQRRGPEPGAAPGDPGASRGGESCQAPEGQLRGDAAAPRWQQCGALDWD